MVWFTTGEQFGGSFRKGSRQKQALDPETTVIGSMTPEGQLTSYSTPQFDGANDIVFGPDGNVWFTYFRQVAIGRMSPDGTVTDFFIPTNSECCEPLPTAITVGRDGAIWYTRSNVIGRIPVTATGGSDIREFPISATPAVSITAGPDGAVWFAEARENQPGGNDGTVTGTWPVAPQITDLVTGADGAVWYTLFGTTPGLGRITTTGTITQYNVPQVSAAEYPHITLGPDGALWFTKGTHIVRAQIANLSPAPTSLTFNHRVDAIAPDAQTFVVSAVGIAVGLRADVSVLSPVGGSWLSVSLSGGATPTTVTVRVNPAGLPVGYVSGLRQCDGSGCGRRPISRAGNFEYSSLRWRPRRIRRRFRSCRACALYPMREAAHFAARGRSFDAADRVLRFPVRSSDIPRRRGRRPTVGYHVSDPSGLRRCDGNGASQPGRCRLPSIRQLYRRGSSYCGVTIAADDHGARDG